MNTWITWTNYEHCLRKTNWKVINDTICNSYIDNHFHKEILSSPNPIAHKSNFIKYNTNKPDKQRNYILTTRDVINTNSLIKPVFISHKPSFISQTQTNTSLSSSSNTKLQRHIRSSSKNRIQCKISSLSKDFLSTTPQHISFFNRPLAQTEKFNNNSFGINYLTQHK